MKKKNNSKRIIIKKKNNNKRYFWFSFSYKGKNQGVVLTESTSKVDAYRKILALDLVPLGNGQDTKCWETPIAEIELDVLIPPEDLEEIGYESTANLCKEDKDKAHYSGIFVPNPSLN